MGTFFNGWQRKTGAVTLVMALALMACWVRSQTYGDSLVLSFDDCGQQHVYDFLSARTVIGHHSFLGYCFYEFSEPDGQPLSYQFQTANLNEIQRQDFGTDLNCQVNSCGFCFGEGTWPALRTQPSSVIRFNVRLIPYWSIVIPLTLLSAHLLRGKPRMANSKGVEQATADGA